MNILKKPQVLSIGDVHGEFEEFKRLVDDSFDKTNMTLVLIGDLIDRGTQSREVLEYVYNLYTDEDVSLVYVRGNHEQLFLDFIDYPTQMIKDFEKNGGKETLISLLGEEFLAKNHQPQDISDKIQEEYSHLIDMVRESVIYYQCNNVLYVHAGISPNVKDYKRTSESDFLWIRDEFTKSKTIWSYLDPEDQLVKTLKVVHGHTPVYPAPKLYYNRINIDGGCCKGGALIGVLLDHHGDLKKVFKVKKKYRLDKPTF